MANDAVLVKNPHRHVPYEDGEAGAAITPGDLIEHDANGELVVNPTAADSAAEVLFADLPVDPEKDKDDAYVDGEAVRAFYGLPGMVVDAFIANNETIAVGDDLVSNGDGALRELNTAGGDTEDAVIAKAAEAVSPTGGEVRCEVRLL